MTPVEILEGGVVLVAAFSAVRLALKPVVRLEVRAQGRHVWWRAFAAGVFGAIGGWAAFRWPLLRHVMVAGVAAAMVAAWWRARPSYGRLRRLPSGSLGLGASLDAISDRRFYLNQATRFGPVFKMSQFGRPVACVVGLDRARTLLALHSTSLIGAPLPYNRLIPRGAVRFMRAEDHKAVAPLLRSTFTDLAFDGFELAVRACYRQALVRLAADSAASPSGVRGRGYFEDAIFTAMGQVFLGLPADDPLLPEVRRLLTLLAIERVGGRAWRERFEMGLAGITRILRSIRSGWSETMADPPPSALRALVQATPDALDNPTFAGNFALIFRLGHNDLNALHDWIFKFLSDNPTALEPVRALGEAGAPGALPDPATCIVMETLRLEQSEFLYRTATRSIEFEGMLIPAGWLVRICVQESHRDPVVFPDPDRFDPDRFARRSFSRVEYSPFGADAHGCMGQRLALFLGRVFVEELAGGFDWRVVSDGPLERGTRHRHHWRPSERFRVVMQRRDST